VPDREPVIARIRRVLRTADHAVKGPAVAAEEDRLDVLEARISHLEALVEGLQDSVHRESSRHLKRISELEARIQPAVLGKALSDDVRERGL
jgi:hypothetical protein